MTLSWRYRWEWSPFLVKNLDTWFFVWYLVFLELKFAANIANLVRISIDD